MEVYTGRINPCSGNPEILCDGKVIAEGRYEGIACTTVDGMVLIAVGYYWQGYIPSSLIGTLLRVSAAPSPYVVK